MSINRVSVCDIPLEFLKIKILREKLPSLTYLPIIPP